MKLNTKIYINLVTFTVNFLHCHTLCFGLTIKKIISLQVSKNHSTITIYNFVLFTPSYFSLERELCKTSAHHTHKGQQQLTAVN